MHILDLTHEIYADMPAYPGDGKTGIISSARHHDHGYQVSYLHLSTHCGTHIDCPRHFFKEKGSTASLPLKSFYGRGMMVDCTGVVDSIPLQLLRQVESSLSETDYLLLRTGWSAYWGTEAYFTGFPVLEIDAANYLTHFQLKGIGVDNPSVDTINATYYPLHHTLLARNILIVENLKIPDNFPGEAFLFSCFPLKIRDGEASPVRAAAIFD